MYVQRCSFFSKSRDFLILEKFHEILIEANWPEIRMISCVNLRVWYLLQILNFREANIIFNV